MSRDFLSRLARPFKRHTHAANSPAFKPLYLAVCFAQNDSNNKMSVRMSLPMSKVLAYALLVICYLTIMGALVDVCMFCSSHASQKKGEKTSRSTG